MIMRSQRKKTFPAGGILALSFILRKNAASFVSRSSIDVASSINGDIRNQRDAMKMLSPLRWKGQDAPLRKRSRGASRLYYQEGSLIGDESMLEDADGIGKQLQGSNLSDPSIVGSIPTESFVLGQGSDMIGKEGIKDTVAAAAVGTSEVGEVKLDDNVSAVLAASEAAAAAAEATLSTRGIDNTPNLLNENMLFVTKPETSDIVPSEQKMESINTSTPDVRKILKFAIPAIGVWLCGPILSLIDTSAVGLLSGTAQQAALNPAVAVTEYAALLLAFMYTATTNLVAGAQETDRGVEGKPRTAKTLIASMQLSGYVGLGLCTALIVFAKLLLRTIIGNDAIDPEVFSAAMKYVQIRALGMPAAVVIGSTQAACLGMQDIKSPLYVLLAAAVVNFFGDVLFVGCSNPLIGGAAGAAWATVFSQYAAMAMFLKWLRSKPRSAPKPVGDESIGEQKPKVVNLTNAILELTGPLSGKGSSGRKSFREALSVRQMSPTSDDAGSEGPKAGRKIFSIFSLSRRNKEKKVKQEDETFSTRGFLAGRLRKRDLLSLPPKETAKEFLPYVLPVTTTSVGRVSSYVAMSHVVSSSLGTAGMAAQQVIVSLFYCLCPIADSLSLTAQSFVPGLFERKKSPERAAALKGTAINFVKAGAIFGSFMVSAVACIPFLTKFFTADPSVIAQINAVVPILAGVFAVHGVVCATEGLLLGQKDLGFLGKAYAGYFAAVPWLMLRVKKAALSGAVNVDLTSVWKVFLGYQLFRTVAWVLRAMKLQKQNDREGMESVATV